MLPRRVALEHALVPGHRVPKLDVRSHGQASIHDSGNRRAAPIAPATSLARRSRRTRIPAVATGRPARAGWLCGLAALSLLAVTFASASPLGAARACAAEIPLPAEGDSSRVSARPAGVGAPSPAEIATLRQLVDQHRIRVRLGEDSFDIRRARFDANGIGFAPGDLRSIVKPDSLGFIDYSARAPLPVSPIPWERIDRVSVQKPCGLRGMAVGGLIGLGAMIAMAATMDVRDAAGPGVLLLAVPLALSPLAGGAIGASIFRSEPGWQRIEDARSAPPGPSAPAHDSTVAAAPPGAPTTVLPRGVIRDQVSDRAVRIWVGPDRLELRRVRLGQRGISFDAGDLRSARSGALKGAGHGSDRGSYSATHIGWDRIDRVETRSGSSERGAVIGMVSVTAIILATSPQTSDAPGDRAASVGGAILVGIPIGAAVGAGIGLLVPRWKTVWRRPAPDSGTSP